MADDAYSLETILCIAIPLSVLALLCILILLILGLRFSCVTQRIQRAHHAERLARIGDLRRTSLSSSLQSTRKHTQCHRNLAAALCCIPSGVYNLPPSNPVLRNSEKLEQIPNLRRNRNPPSGSERGQISGKNGRKPRGGRDKQEITSTVAKDSKDTSAQLRKDSAILGDNQDGQKSSMHFTDQNIDEASNNIPTDTSPVLSDLGMNGLFDRNSVNSQNLDSFLSYPAVLGTKGSSGSNGPNKEASCGRSKHPYTMMSRRGSHERPDNASKSSEHDYTSAVENVPAIPTTTFQSPSRDRDSERYYSMEYPKSTRFGSSTSVRDEASTMRSKRLVALDHDKNSQLGPHGSEYDMEDLNIRGTSVSTTYNSEEPMDLIPPARSALRPKVTPRTSVTGSTISRSRSGSNTPTQTGAPPSSESGPRSPFLKWTSSKSSLTRTIGSPGMKAFQESDSDSTSYKKPRDSSSHTSVNPLMAASQQQAASHRKDDLPQSHLNSVSGFPGQKPELRNSPSKQLASSSPQTDTLSLTWNTPSVQRPTHQARPHSPSPPELTSTYSEIQPTNLNLRKPKEMMSSDQLPSVKATYASIPGGGQFSASKSNVSPLQNITPICPVMSSEHHIENSQSDVQTGLLDISTGKQEQLVGKMPAKLNIHESNQRFGRTEVERGHSTVHSIAGSLVTPGNGDPKASIFDSPVTTNASIAQEKSFRHPPQLETLDHKEHENFLRTKFQTHAKTGKDMPEIPQAQPIITESINPSKHAKLLGSPMNRDHSAITKESETTARPGLLNSPLFDASHGLDGDYSPRLKDLHQHLDQSLWVPQEKSKTTGPSRLPSTRQVLDPESAIPNKSADSDPSTASSPTRRPDPWKNSGTIGNIAAFKAPTSPRSPGYQPGHVKALISNTAAPDSTAVSNTDEDNTSGRYNIIASADKRDRTTVVSTISYSGVFEKGIKRPSTSAYGSKASSHQLEKQTKSAKPKANKSKRINKPLPSTPPLQEGGVVTNLGGAKYSVLYGYNAKLNDELDLDPGDVVKVFEVFDDGWCLARIAKSTRLLTGRNNNGVCPRSCLSRDALPI